MFEFNCSRDSQFKIKGISMSLFTEEDIHAIAGGGNEASNSVLLARIGDYSVPNGNDVNKLKDFIKLKYVDKKWTVGGGSHGHNTSSSRDYGGNNGNSNHNSSNYSSESNRGTFATPSNTNNTTNDGWGGSNNDNWGDSGGNAFGDNNNAGGSSAPIVIKSLGNVVKTPVSFLFYSVHSSLISFTVCHCW
jgi:hypothetical protein